MRSNNVLHPSPVVLWKILYLKLCKHGLTSCQHIQILKMRYKTQAIGSIYAAIIITLILAFYYIQYYRSNIDLPNFQDFRNRELQVDINITPRNPALERYYRKLCTLDKKRIERIKTSILNLKHWTICKSFSTNLSWILTMLYVWRSRDLEGSIVLPVNIQTVPSLFVWTHY